MMAKLIQGCGFSGAVSYVDKVVDKHATILSHRGVNLTSHSALVNSFDVQRLMNPSVKNYVGHLVLSFSPRDRGRMTSELMNKIALEYMDMMGIRKTQYAVFRHRDQPHDHVHVIYNRVDDDGEPITTDTNFRKSVAVTKLLTKKYGLTWGKGKEKVRRERLKGKDKSKYAIYDAIKSALRHCKTVEQLRIELMRRGIDMRFKTDAFGKITGVSFGDGKSSFAGSRIDKSLKWSVISQQLEKNRVAGLDIKINIVEKPSGVQGMAGARLTESVKPATVESVSAEAVDTSNGNDNAVANNIQAVMEFIAPIGAPHVGTGSGSSNNSTKTESEIEREKSKANVYKPRRRR